MKNRIYYVSLLLCFTVFNSCTTQENVDWKKYEVITNVDELIEFFPDLNLNRDTKYQNAEITKYFDGSKELTYEYELLESDIFDSLYYSITIETILPEIGNLETFSLDTN